MPLTPLRVASGRISWLSLKAKKDKRSLKHGNVSRTRSTWNRKPVKGSIRKIPSESVIRLWRNFLRQCLIRGLEVDFCSLPFRKKLYRRSIKNPNPFPIWKIWFGLYAFGAGGGGRTRTSLRTRDFESRASANSTTPAWGITDLV